MRHLPLISALAFGFGLTLGRRLRQWLEKKKRGAFDGLTGVVSHSSRVIAAWRAVETLQEDHLFTDPFAAALAGQAAFQEALQNASKYEGDTSMAPWRRQYQISNVASRVWWFDQQILEALNPSQAGSAAGSTRSTTQLGSSPAIRPVVEKAAVADRRSHQNVVVLGSGMDTRPWRLDLPSGVHWYEIDREDVLSAKQRALQQLGVQFSRRGQPPAAAGEGKVVTAFPLKAKSWTALEADLCSPGWSQRLQAAGFDPSLPTVWVAEGLLMYLTQQEVDALLQEMAESSSQGSTLVVHQTGEELLQLLQQGDVDYPPFSMELMRTWYSGFPLDPTQRLAKAGWQLEQAITRAQIAHEICGGSPEGRCDFDITIGQGRDRYAVFVVAKKLAGNV